MRFEFHTPSEGMFSEENIVDALSAPQLSRLREHALALACLDGNAFPPLIDQYLPEAYASLWQNSHLGDIPDLYANRAAQSAANEVASENLAHILFKAADIFNDRDKAFDWIDQMSATLGGTPRSLARTAEGTKQVLLHLAGISRSLGIDA